ncbi:MAG TPA: hypothetical protein VHU23_16735 [Rhizomicrobium sp.]|nr:hypothetical protein [Rhizomicrobium sp.]
MTSYPPQKSFLFLALLTVMLAACGLSAFLGYTTVAAIAAVMSGAICAVGGVLIEKAKSQRSLPDPSKTLRAR